MGRGEHCGATECPRAARAAPLGGRSTPAHHYLVTDSSPLTLLDYFSMYSRCCVERICRFGTHSVTHVAINSSSSHECRRLLVLLAGPPAEYIHAMLFLLLLPPSAIRDACHPTRGQRVQRCGCGRPKGAAAGDDEGFPWRPNPSYDHRPFPRRQAPS